MLSAYSVRYGANRLRKVVEETKKVVIQHGTHPTLQRLSVPEKVGIKAATHAIENKITAHNFDDPIPCLQRRHKELVLYPALERSAEAGCVISPSLQPRVPNKLQSTCPQCVLLSGQTLLCNSRIRPWQRLNAHQKYLAIRPWRIRTQTAPKICPRRIYTTVRCRQRYDRLPIHTKAAGIQVGETILVLNPPNSCLTMYTLPMYPKQAGRQRSEGCLIRAQRAVV